MEKVLGKLIVGNAIFIESAGFGKAIINLYINLYFRGKTMETKNLIQEVISLPIEERAIFFLFPYLFFDLLK